MKTISIFSTLIALLFSGVFLPAKAQSFNPNLAAKLQHTLDSVSTLLNTKGASVAVYYPGQGVWKSTVGLSHAGTPLTSDMTFGMASNTKLFVAATIMKLVERNILSLNDSLHKWIPKYANIDSTITIRQLLNHTSGIADILGTSLIDSIKKYPAKIYSLNESLSWVGTKMFSPGASQYYSNTNYILAGMIAESATGYHISRLIRDSILTPLQLGSTTYALKETIVGIIAHPWVNGVDEYAVSRDALHSVGGAAGSIYSKPSEMVQWYQALLSGQILSAASLSQMTNFVGGMNYGLGISKMTISAIGKTVWGHGGNTMGYNSRMMYYPPMKAIICAATNYDQQSIEALSALLLKTLTAYLPENAGVVSGATSVCQGQNSVTYSIAPILKASSYVWTLPNGITGTSTTNSITVNISASATSGTISVAGVNTYGTGAVTTCSITVLSKPTILIAGASSVAENTSKQYSISPISGAITWSVSGGILSSGQGTTQATVTWGSAGAGSVDVAVQLANGCIATQTSGINKLSPALGSALALWYNASHISGAISGQMLPFSAPYTQSHPSWEDVSGNGRGAYMLGGNDILIPSYYADGAHSINGNPAVLFDNINDALIVNNSAAVNAGTEKMLFAVFKTGANISSKQVIFESGSGAATHSGFNIYISNGQICFGVWSGSTSKWMNTSCTANTIYIAQLVYDGVAGTLGVAVNAESATSTGVPTSLPQGTQYNGLGSAVQGTRMASGYTNSTIDFPFGGSIGDIFLYNSVSTSARNQTFAYLDAKYGVGIGGNPVTFAGNFEILSNTSDIDISVGNYSIDLETVGVLPTDAKENTNMTIAPNPATDAVKIGIKADQTDEIEMSVYDILGRKVLSASKSDVQEGWNTFFISTQNLHSGMYRIVISGQHTAGSAFILISR